MRYYLAVDIGASSGRCILSSVQEGTIVLEEVHRFPNRMEMVGDSSCWDVGALFSHILEGMRRCKELGKIPSFMGIDTWGVDFVLLDGDDRMVGPAVAYRDGRTRGMDRLVESVIPQKELYGRTGIQKQQFNTIYQLMALKQTHPDHLQKARHLLFIPDYLTFLLTGSHVNEYTVATTSSLADAATGEWDRELAEMLGFPPDLFSLPLTRPGTVIGGLREEIARSVGFDLSYILPPSHDTASAVLAVPAEKEYPLYISSGTWSLMGVENHRPILTEESRVANFTNEGGYDGRYRYLKNIMGLWMIQSCRACWDNRYSFADLEQMARSSKIGTEAVVDVNDNRFLAPSNMVQEVTSCCKERNGIDLQTPGDVMQCIYLSLAESYGKTVGELQELTGKQFAQVNIVGGGSKDGYLDQLTANRCGLPVAAGPTEGTALGNLVVQMLADGTFPSLSEARAAIRRSFPLKEYVPE